MEKKDRYISIGEMAKINRTTVPTLRLYDSMGLLTPYYTDEETHYRYYDIKQNARFDMIQYMKELGMELKEIKELFDKQDINLIEQILRQKKEQTVVQMQELKFKCRRLTGRLQALNGIRNRRKAARLHWNTYRTGRFTRCVWIPIFTIITLICTN